jgi:pimeloyl-ACP methyl ester carboxylesterase
MKIRYKKVERFFRRISQRMTVGEMGHIQSRNIAVNGRDVHYYTAGQGEPLVVVHGGGADARSWLRNIEVLAEKYTVYAPDLPGFGQSQPLEGDYYIPEMAEFVESFADSLGLKYYYLMGHSVGGGVALHCALRSPQKVKKLVLISSLCLGREIALWVRVATLPARFITSLIIETYKVARWLVGTLLIPVEMVMPRSPISLSLGRHISTVKEQTVVLANRLSELVMPTLVIWGKHDEVVPVRHAYTAAQVIPQCQLKVFEHCGHNVHRDEIGEFSRLLNGFLG